MRILLTGANSFVGSHIAQHLLAARHTLIASFRISNPAAKKLALHPSAPTIVTLDLSDRAQLVQLPGSIDAVIHVAGVSHTPPSTLDEILACNVLGTQNIIEYARQAGARLLIYTSTLSVHGRVDAPVVDQETPISDPNVYGASKYLAERLIAAESHWLPSYAIRLPGVLGAGAPPRAWIPKLIYNLIQNEDVTIYNQNGLFNNAVHVDDLGNFCVHLLAIGGNGFQAFPLGAGGMTNVSAAVTLLSENVKSNSRIIRLDQSSSAFTICNSKALSLGYSPMHINEVLHRYSSDLLASS